MPVGALADQGRRTERVAPSTELIVQLQGSDLPVELWDVSLGGFAIRCRRPFHIGMTHRFVFTAVADGRSTTLVAKAVHSRASSDAGDLRFVTGWEFMSARSRLDQAAISQLFLSATARDQ